MKEVSIGVPAVATTKTTVYTVPANHYAKWNLVFASNTTSSAKWFSAIWYDKSADAEISVANQFPIPAKEYLRIDGGAYVVLEEGDEIRIQAEATTVTCILTFELVQKNATKVGV
jgi:hypothetical protein